MKDKPTPVEKHDDGNGKIGEQVIHFGEGLLDSIVDLVKGLADSTVGIVKYDASFVTYLYGELSGNEIPKWADDYCYNTSVETNEKIKAVLNDPLIVADAIKNGGKDTYEEKGAAYCGGYAVGFIGTTFAGTKGMDKLAKIGKGGKAARTLEELGYVDDAMVTVSKASDVTMDVVANGSKVFTKTAGGAEAGGMVATVGDDLAKLAEEVKTVTKAADTAEDLTKVAGKIQTATKAEELSEASKVLAEGGEVAGKGGVVEEVVSKSGSNLGFTVDEINKLKSTVINEGQMLKDMGLTNDQLGPAISGAYDKTTGKIYTAINDYDGKVPTELAPIIRERIENMPPEVLDFYIKTKGAGSHAEIYAANKLLLDNPNAELSDIAIYVNRTLGTSKPVIEKPFVTCPHCRYILEGFNIISNN